MKKLTLQEITVSAENGCVCSSKTLAERYFREIGAKGRTGLCETVVDGATYILWVNADCKSRTYLPVFLTDAGLDLPKDVKFTPIEGTTLIYQRHKNGYGVCYMVVANGDIIIRQLKIIATEQLLQNYCALQGIVPEDVTMEKMFTIGENRYLSTCWAFSYANKNELTKSGEPQKYVSFVPVDLADSDILDEIDLTNIRTEPLKKNDIFQVQGTNYRVMRDSKGYLFFTDDLFSPEDGEPADSKPAEDEKKPEAEESECKIIPLH